MKQNPFPKYPIYLCPGFKLNSFMLFVGLAYNTQKKSLYRMQNSVKKKKKNRKDNVSKKMSDFPRCIIWSDILLLPTVSCQKLGQLVYIRSSNFMQDFGN